MIVTGPPAMIPRNNVAEMPDQLLHILKAAATTSRASRVLGIALWKMASFRQGQISVLVGALKGGVVRIKADLHCSNLWSLLQYDAPVFGILPLRSTP
jgi:hypothetical protein